MYYIKEYFREGLLILVLFLNVFIFCFLVFFDQDDKNDVTSSVVESVVSEDTNIVEDFDVRVDIKGAVLNPGVYIVNSNSCINDVIAMAGGLKSNASTKYINLSKKVADEMVINIFTTSQVKKLEVNEPIKEECKCETIYINECNNSSIIQPGENNVNVSGENVIKDKLISINSATKDELMQLNGIGEAKANAIIEYRNSNGDFNKIEDLKNVSGISDSLYEKIKDYITV